MTKEERDAIRSFMYQVLQQMHPHWREYPLQEMSYVENSYGEDFEGTCYEGTDYLVAAYYMKKAADVFSG